MAQESFMVDLSTLLAQIKIFSLIAAKALLILVVGLLVAKWCSRNAKRLLAKLPHFDPTLGLFVAGSTHYGIMLLVFIAVLAQFGVQTASIITVLGTAGLAIGLALQGTLSNIASGFMILLLRPIKVGEYIEAGDIAGTVKMIGLFATQLSTMDGIYITATNSQLWSRTIKNYTRNPTRRIDLIVGIAYENDINHAKEVLLTLAKETDGILNEPEPMILVKELANSSVNLNLRCWVKQENYWNLYSELNKSVKEKLAQEKIMIPYPQHDIYVKQLPILASNELKLR